MDDQLKKQDDDPPGAAPEVYPANANEAWQQQFQATVIKAADNLAAALAAVKQKNSPDSTGQNIVSVEQGYKDRDYYSGKVSEIARQLGFAGIAIVWVFKVGEGTLQAVPIQLVPPALLLVLGLAFDLIHYLTATALWQVLTSRAHKAGREEFVAPSWINTPAWLLFIAKIIFIGSAYLYLIMYLALVIILRTFFR